MSKEETMVRERIEYLKKQIAIREQNIKYYTEASRALIVQSTAHSSQIAAAREANAKRYQQLAEIKKEESASAVTKEVITSIEEAAHDILGQILLKKGLLSSEESDF